MLFFVIQNLPNLKLKDQIKTKPLIINFKVGMRSSELVPHTGLGPTKVGQSHGHVHNMLMNQPLCGMIEWVSASYKAI